MVTGNGTARAVAFYNIAAGIVGALGAAVPGFIDYLTLQGRPARVGTWHMALNLVALAVFAVSWVLRTRWGAGSLVARSRTVTRRRWPGDPFGDQRNLALDTSSTLVVIS